MIKQRFENLISQFSMDKTQVVKDIEKEVRERKILPFNTNIDVLLQQAIAEKEMELKTKIRTLTNEFESVKETLIAQASAKKAENERTVLTQATNAKTYQYDLVIKQIRDFIANLPEEE